MRQIKTWSCASLSLYVAVMTLGPPYATKNGIQAWYSLYCEEILYVAYLKSPYTSIVIAALKALRLQTFFQTGFDAGQSRNPCTDHCHLLKHAGIKIKQIKRVSFLISTIKPADFCWNNERERKAVRCVAASY